jgi:hypothetical protein
MFHAEHFVCMELYVQNVEVILIDEDGENSRFGRERREKISAVLAPASRKSGDTRACWCQM